MQPLALAAPPPVTLRDRHAPEREPGRVARRQVRRARERREPVLVVARLQVDGDCLPWDRRAVRATSVQ